MTFADISPQFATQAAGLFEIRSKSTNALCSFGFLIGWKMGITTTLDSINCVCVFPDGQKFDIDSEGKFINSELKYTIF